MHTANMLRFHLCKALLEVVSQVVGPAGQHRQWNVIAHAVCGFCAVRSHAFNDHAAVLLAEAVGSLKLQHLQDSMPRLTNLAKATEDAEDAGGFSTIPTKQQNQWKPH